MKIKNSPARKLRRQIVAQQGRFADLQPENAAKIQAARDVRTKKYRGVK